MRSCILLRRRGDHRPQHFMQAFRDAIDDCILSDFGFVGDKFTWHRGRTRERLDRALTNEAWSERFGDAVLQNLEYSNSDHRPVIMVLETKSNYASNGPSVLRFEVKWLNEARFHQVVQERPGRPRSEIKIILWWENWHWYMQNCTSGIARFFSAGRRGFGANNKLERVASGALTGKNV